MGWLFTLLGIVIVGIGLLDVFQTLLHPSGRGRLSWLVVTAVWRVSKGIHHKLGTFTGPVAVILIIGLWGLLQTIGWALIYYPHIPQGYSYTDGIPQEQYADIAEAVYVSMVTLATLGFGDVVPVDHWIRLVSPLQALTGFALLTAAVSWFMQIYPALAQRRALALRLTLLHRTGFDRHLHDMDPVAAARLLDTLSADLVQIRIHFTQNSETYYFREANDEISLPATLGFALELSAEAGTSQHACIRHSGEYMRRALDDLAAFLSSQFAAPGESTVEVFEFFTADHGHPQDSHRRPGPAAGK